MTAAAGRGPGRRGPWALVRALGGGEDTEVWLAERGGHRSALKVLRASDDRRVRMARLRLAREVAALEQVGPVGVVVLEDLADDEEPWLAFRYEAAGTLAHRLRRGALSALDAAATLAPVADVLDRAHRRGVVHRDVTPANLLLAANGPLVADWASASASGTAFDGWLHGVRAVLGTAGFVAPEARAGTAAPAPALDVWSLGAVLAAAVGPASDGVDADGPLRELIARCLRADPDRRPAMAEVAERLAGLAVGGSPVAEPEPPTAGAPARGGEGPSAAASVPSPARVAGPASSAVPWSAAHRNSRRSVLDELRRHRLEATERGELGAVLVAAAPGAGKSWLLAAAEREATADGWLVVRAACEPTGAGLPVLAPWVSGVERALGERSGRPPRRDTRLAAVTGAVAAGEVGPLAVSDALAELLDDVGPTLCLLDDVHLAEPELVEVLEGLAYRGGAGGLVVSAGRPQGVDADDLGATALRLDPLDEAAVGAIVEDVLGRPPTATELAAVVGVADGNPLHAREAARAVARGEAVADRSLVELVARRLGSLPGADRASHEVAALCGPAFWPEVLGPDVVDAAIDLVEGGIVVPRLRSRVGGAVELRFAHPVFQEVAEAVIAPDRRVALHARVARALDGAGAPPGLVVAHAVAAVDGGVIDLRDDARRVAVAAARESLDHLALDAAADQLSAARRLATGAPSGPGAAPIDHVGELAVLEAELAVRRGRPAEALASLGDLLDAAGAVGVAARQVGVEAAFAAGQLERADRLAARSLAELDPASAAWGRCAIVAAGVWLRRGAAGPALDLADRAESLLAGLDDRSGRASAAVTAAMASSEVEWAARGVSSETARRAVRASSLLRSVDRRRWVQAAPALVDALYPTDWPAARRLAAEAAEVAASTGDAVALPALAYFCADFAFEAGDRDEVDRWVGVLGPGSHEGVWAASAAALRVVVDAASRPGGADTHAPRLVQLAVRARAAGDEQWSTLAATAVALFLWEGRPTAAAELAGRLGLDRGAPDLGPLATLRSLRGGPPPPEVTADAMVGVDADPRRVDDLALVAALSGDHDRADALLRHRAAQGRAIGAVRVLRMIATYPGYLAWALGPEDTDPPVDQLLRWLHHDRLPGVWVLHRVLVGLVLAERGTPGVDPARLRALLASVPAEPELAGWVGARLDRC